jgi:putative endonuclease
MFYVYMIKSVSFPEQHYVGCTDNLNERLNTHNSGGSVYTKPYRPWILVVYLGFQEETVARKFERYLKSGAGRAFAKKRFW